MPETELLTQLTEVLGPVGGFLAFIAIGAWWFMSKRQERRDNGSREETRGNIREIKADVKDLRTDLKDLGQHQDGRMDRHLEQHAGPAD